MKILSHPRPDRLGHAHGDARVFDVDGDLDRHHHPENTNHLLGALSGFHRHTSHTQLKPIPARQQATVS